MSTKLRVVRQIQPRSLRSTCGTALASTYQYNTGVGSIELKQDKPMTVCQGAECEGRATKRGLRDLWRERHPRGGVR